MNIISDNPILEKTCSEIISELRKISIKQLRIYKEITVEQLTVSKLNGEEREAKASKVLLRCVNKVLNEKV